MIYLDYSATTPVLPEILDSYLKVSNEYWGNPNSLHSLGTKSRELMSVAIKQICDILHIKEEESIFTSGATEANNLAIIGTALARAKKGARIILSKLEHDSIYVICNYLEKNGFIIDYVNNDAEGIIDFEDLKKLIKPETILVSIGAVNSELGVRQPLKTIKQIINKENPSVILHSDMTQALGKVSVNVSDVDLASLSAHKIYGPKGIGLLYKKAGVRIKPLMYGAGTDFRPGTPPIPLIVTFAKALRMVTTDLAKKEEKVEKHNEKICTMLKKYPEIKINKTKYSIPHILNISLMTIKPETFIHALAKQEIYVGSNTACASGKLSTAVLNLYKDKKRAMTTLRISLSYLTKNDEISVFLSAFEGIYQKLAELNHESL